MSFLSDTKVKKSWPYN